MMNSTTNSDSVSTSSTTTSEQVTNTWCHNKSVTFKIVHTWTIDDFSFYLNSSTDYFAISSSKFSSVSNDEVQFCIKLYPNGDEEADKDYLSIFLFAYFAEESTTAELRTQYKFSLIDKTGKMCHTSSYGNKPKNETGYGKNKFLLRSLLLDPNSALLPDDKLTIHCEVRVSMDRYTISSNDPKPGIINTMHQNTFSANLKTLLDKGTHSDVLLVIGSTQYSAHKNILSARSPVFGAMFAHKDIEENVQNRVDIIDIPVETFQELLNYIYSGQVPEKEKLTSELLSASDKYQIEPLKAACEEALSSGFDVDTVTSLLVLADMHNADKLKVKCIEYITGHATDVMLTDGWEQMFKTRPELALQTYRDLAVQAHPIMEQKKKLSNATVATDSKDNGE